MMQERAIRIISKEGTYKGVVRFPKAIDRASKRLCGVVSDAHVDFDKPLKRVSVPLSNAHEIVVYNTTSKVPGRYLGMVLQGNQYIASASLEVETKADPAFVSAFLRVYHRALNLATKYF